MEQQQVTPTTLSKESLDRATSTKEYLDSVWKNRKQQMADRRARRIDLAKRLAAATDDAERRRIQTDFDSRERELMRETRKRYTPNDFDPLIIIGRGAFGEVKVVRAKEDGAIYAMKSMKKEAMILKNQVAHVKSERDALAESTNPWVVGLHFSFQDDDNLYLVMDYCPGGDLMTLLIKEDILPEKAVRFYAAEAVLAIASVHALGYIHRDLKPDNLLLDARGHLKVGGAGGGGVAWLLVFSCVRAFTQYFRSQCNAGTGALTRCMACYSWYRSAHPHNILRDMVPPVHVFHAPFCIEILLRHTLPPPPHPAAYGPRSVH